MDRLELKIPPPLQMLLAAVLQGWLAVWQPWAAIPVPGQRWLAIALAATGLLCGLLGMRAFHGARTTLNPHHPDRTRMLVTGGIYRVSRNPMYLGLLLMLFGGVFWWANPFALIPIPLFVVYINRFQIHPEERWMRDRFGEAYRDYRAQVRRWI